MIAQGLLGTEPGSEGDNMFSLNPHSKQVFSHMVCNKKAQDSLRNVAKVKELFNQGTLGLNLGWTTEIYISLSFFPNIFVTMKKCITLLQYR